MRQFQGTWKPSVLQGSGQCIKIACTVLVPSDCCNSDWVIYQHLFLTVLEAGSLRSMGSQIHCLVRTQLLFTDHDLLPVSSEDEHQEKGLTLFPFL